MHREGIPCDAPFYPAFGFIKILPRKYPARRKINNSELTSEILFPTKYDEGSKANFIS
jgi:hypothetical protein